MKVRTWIYKLFAREDGCGVSTGQVKLLEVAPFFVPAMDETMLRIVGRDGSGKADKTWPLPPGSSFWAAFGRVLVETTGSADCIADPSAQGDAPACKRRRVIRSHTFWLEGC